MGGCASRPKDMDVKAKPVPEVPVSPKEKAINVSQMQKGITEGAETQKTGDRPDVDSSEPKEEEAAAALVETAEAERPEEEVAVYRESKPEETKVEAHHESKPEKPKAEAHESKVEEGKVEAQESKVEETKVEAVVSGLKIEDKKE